MKPSTPITSPSESKVTPHIQERIVFQAFAQKSSTMKEADKATGIMRENICRYIKTFRDAGKIVLLHKRLCNVTGHRAGVYTADPKLFPPAPKQMGLFDAGTIATIQNKGGAR